MQRLWLMLLIACATTTPAEPARPTSGPGAAAGSAATAPPFEFHVGFWVNLHQRLYEESSARPRPGALELAVPADRDAWSRAVAFYRTRYPSRGFVSLLEDAELVRVNRELAKAERAGNLAAADLPAEVRSALEAVAPTYRAHGWPTDEAAGSRFEQRLATLITAHGRALTDAIARAYATPWPTQPIRVDIAAYAGPVAAYTVLDPPHITIASGDRRHDGDAALEIIFHEASHALVERVEQSIVRACAAQHRTEPPQLWHAMLFWGTGEIVRRELGAGYTPYGEANGLYARSPVWQAAQPLLARHWRDYLDGKLGLDAAVDQIVAGMPST